MRNLAKSAKEFVLLFLLGLGIFVVGGSTVAKELVTKQEAPIPRGPDEGAPKVNEEESVPKAELEARCVPFKQFNAFIKDGGYTKLHTSIVVLDFNAPFDINKNAFVSFYVNPERFFVMAFASVQAPNFVCVVQGHSLKVDDWTGLFEQTPASKDPI